MLLLSADIVPVTYRLHVYEENTLIANNTYTCLPDEIGGAAAKVVAAFEALGMGGVRVEHWEA